MTRVSPKQMVSTFEERITAAVDYHKELLVAVSGKRREAGLEKMLVEQFTLNVAVLWEVFLSDLLICYLALSHQHFTQDLKKRMLQSATERYGQAACGLLTFNIPKNISLPRARALADPKDFNLSIQSASALTERANKLLAAKYAKLFTLNPDEAQFIDFIISLRNFLAHRSKSARETLKLNMAGLAGANTPLKSKSVDFGTYLKSKDANGETKSIIIARRLSVLASLLA